MHSAKSMKQFESLVKKAETLDDLYGSVVSFNIERIESGQSPIWSFGNKHVLEQRERELIGTSTNYEMISETRQRIFSEKLATAIKIHIGSRREGLASQIEVLLNQPGVLQVPPKELIDAMNFKGDERLRHYHLVHYLRTLLWATLINKHPEKENQLQQEEYVVFPEMCFEQPNSNKVHKSIRQVIDSAAPLILEVIPESLMPKLPTINEFVWRKRKGQYHSTMTKKPMGKYSMPLPSEVYWRNDDPSLPSRLDQLYDTDTKREIMYTFFEILKIIQGAAKVLGRRSKSLERTPLSLPSSHYAVSMLMLRNYAINFTLHQYLESQGTSALLSPLGRRMGMTSMIDSEKGLTITYPADADGTLAKVSFTKITEFLNSSRNLPIMHLYLYEVAEFCKAVCEELDSGEQLADV